jgi:hypothetical protein
MVLVECALWLNVDGLKIPALTQCAIATADGANFQRAYRRRLPIHAPSLLRSACRPYNDASNRMLMEHAHRVHLTTIHHQIQHQRLATPASRSLKYETREMKELNELAYRTASTIFVRILCFGYPTL